ncbi:MAG TPA: hypothetical protein VGM51_17570, partial [Armatimonadota bacterium]
MTRSLKLYIAGLVGASALALVITSLAFGLNRHIAFGFWGPPSTPTETEVVLGLGFWTAVTLFASALPVPMPRGMLVSVSIAPILASAYLGGPAAGAFVALIGSTEMRELRGRIPWYGTLANHAGVVIPTVAAGLLIELLGRHQALLVDFAALLVASIAYFGLNVVIVSVLLALRTGQPVRRLLVGDTRNFAASLVGLAPISWLMGQMYVVAWWAALLFALPLYTTRLAYHNFIEMREMFTQTITALAGAVDKRDPYTSKHSWRVKE